jgi:amino acid permease
MLVHLCPTSRLLPLTSPYDTQAIALGLLSFPSIFQRLGLAGGLIATILLALLAYITAWIYIDFKLRYMGCMNVADAGRIMFGRIGGIIFGVGIMVKSIGLAASHALAGEIALTNISNGATCKIVVTVVICVVSVLVSVVGSGIPAVPD